jgi:hypothetical protein
MSNIQYCLNSTELQDLISNILNLSKFIQKPTLLQEPSIIEEPTILKEPSIIEEPTIVKEPVIGFNTDEFNKFFNTPKKKITEEERIKRNNYHRNYYKNNIKKNKS